MAGRVEDPNVFSLTDSDIIGADLSYQAKTLTGFTYSEAVPCADTTLPPAGPAVCSISRDGTNVTVTWSNVVWPDITIHRSVDGGELWRRGVKRQAVRAPLSTPIDARKRAQLPTSAPVWAIGNAGSLLLILETDMTHRPRFAPSPRSPRLACPCRPLVVAMAVIRPTSG
ncbi:MAG: hypothetical protein R2706_02860 [Acidimicrobiales bacterium]